MAMDAVWFTTDDLDRVAPTPGVARRVTTEGATTEMLGVRLLVGTIAVTTMAMAAAVLWASPSIQAGSLIASALWR